MKFIIQTTFSAIVSIALIAISFNVPAKWFDLTEDRLGTVSVTTLNSTDNVSDFPTTYNANLNALNNGKVDVASTTWAQLTTAANLSTVGTITSGTWNGSTIGCAYGGVGTTSVSADRVIFGNGSNCFKTSTSTGDVGQFLTSFGAGVAPQWTTSAISESGNYNWTGAHTFASTTLSYQNSGTTTVDGYLALGVNVDAQNTFPNWYAVDSVGTDAYSILLTPAAPKYTTGMQIAFKPNATNTLDSTLNVNGLGAVSIKTKNGVDTRTGDIRPNAIAQVIYDGTNFILQNPQQASVETKRTQIYSNQLCPSNTSFTDINLGSTIGTTTSLAYLRVVVNSGNGHYAVFRTNGDTTTTASSTGAHAIHINVDTPVSGDSFGAGYVMVKTDETGTIEWTCSANGGNTFNIFVEGYWNQ